MVDVTLITGDGIGPEIAEAMHRCADATGAGINREVAEAGADVMDQLETPLPQPDAERIMVCPESGYRYKEVEPGVLRYLDLDEDAPLPPDKAISRVSYDNVHRK